MKDKDYEKVLKESLKSSYHEVNVHDGIMEKVEQYEMKKLKGFYFFEIVFSSMLIIACLVSIGFVYWYFSVYGAVFSILPGSSALFRDISIGMFLIFIIVLFFILFKSIRFVIGDKNRSVKSG